MTPNTTPTTITIQLTKKGKLRVVGADMPDTNQRKYQLYKRNHFDCGRSILASMRVLACKRKEQDRAIQVDELLRFLDALDATLARGSLQLDHGLSVLNIAGLYHRRWFEPYKAPEV